MSKRNKVLKIRGSNFNRNEQFGLNNVPKHFDSVTDEEIERLKNIVMSEIEDASRFKPGALMETLKSVDGHFESAYSTLEGDYGTRLSNLDEVRTRSLTKLRKACDAFELQAAEHNLLFEKYSEASEKIEGKGLPARLMITDDEIDEITSIAKKIKGGSEND